MTTLPPHIGPSKIPPGSFGYEFDLSLSDCHFRYNSDGAGGLLIIPPEGKRVGLNIGREVARAQILRDTLESLIHAYDSGAVISEKIRRAKEMLSQHA